MWECYPGDFSISVCRQCPPFSQWWSGVWLNYLNDGYLGEASIFLKGENQGLQEKKGKLVGCVYFHSEVKPYQSQFLL